MKIMKLIKKKAAKDVAQLVEMPHPGIRYVWDIL